MNHFDARAKEWDKKTRRQTNAKKIADAIKEKINLTKEMDILDFGVGTGLLGFEIAKDVKQVYGVDTSKGMLENLKKKNDAKEKIIPIHQNILQKPLEKTFHGVVSSMTLHHIQDIEHFFYTIYNTLKKNSFLAIADLEKENGSFHSDNSTVFHFGFEKEKLCKIVEKNRFKDINIQTVNKISKPHGEFKVFLLTAYK